MVNRTDSLFIWFVLSQKKALKGRLHKVTEFGMYVHIGTAMCRYDAFLQFASSSNVYMFLWFPFTDNCGEIAYNCAIINDTEQWAIYEIGGHQMSLAG